MHYEYLREKIVAIEHSEIIAFIKWALGGAGAAALALLTFWWRVESNQNKKIEDLHKENHDAHQHLHDKVDKVRDKVEEIWKHLVRRNGGKNL